MRLQVNKTCRNLDDKKMVDFYTKVQQDEFGKKLDDSLEGPGMLSKNSAVRHTPFMELHCRYCENCETELFGLWLWFEWMWVRYKEPVYELFLEYEKERNVWENDLQRIRKKEINHFRTMSVCPVCNEPLQDDAAHYYKESDKYSLDSKRILSKILGYVYLNDPKGYNEYKQTSKEKLDQYLEEVLDEIFEKRLQHKIKYYEIAKEKALALTNDFVNCNDSREEFSVLYTTDTNVIKGNMEKLKEYLLKVILIENNVYSLTKRLNDLYEQRILNDSALNRVIYAPVVESINNKNLLLSKINEEIDNTTNLISKKKTSIDELNKELEYLINIDRDELVKLEITKPTEPKLKKVGLFNKEATISNNNKLQQEYELALEKYNQEIEALNKQIDEKIIDLKNSISQNKQMIDETSNKHNQLLKMFEEKENEVVDYAPAAISDVPLCSEKAIHDLLDEEINLVEDLLKKTLDERKRLYDMNVIFGKYRDVVALTTFYEYLVAGRCSDLDGPNGAYNLYESECRANLIISKLSEVVSLLEDIKGTQYMLYSALNSINRELATLNDTTNKALSVLSSIEMNTTVSNSYLDNIAKNSQVIAYNTEKTAYYSKKTAELTNSLGYMIALS